MNISRFSRWIVVSAMLVGAALLAFSSQASAKAGSASFSDPSRADLSPGGPTGANCFSTDYHAASDCDRLSSMQLPLASTGRSAEGPTAKNCYSDAFHAASDCDRIASTHP